MTKKLLLVFTVIGLAVASAKTFTVNLYEPAMVGAVELKPGVYQLEINNTTAVLKSGKTKTEAQVKVEQTDQKYSTTTVRFANGDGKMKIQEIRLGGTKEKLVFNE